MCNIGGGIGLLDTLQVTSEILDKRAERKAVTSGQIDRLLALNSTIHEQYERTLRCSETLFLKECQTTGEVKVTANYCGKRWCSVCSAIKTAEMMKGYYTSVQALPDIHFVTLTVPAVTGEHLKSTIRGMLKEFTKVKDVLRKQGHPISGIRKLECNFNPKMNTYNPHFHLIISGRIKGTEVIYQWLKRYPEAVQEAQDIRKADEGTLQELFKYSVKSLIGKKFYPEAQDIIYRSLIGCRTFQNFGDVKKQAETADNSLPEGEHLITQDIPAETNFRTIETYHWNRYLNNWISSKGEILHHTSIRKKVLKMIHHIREG